MTHSWGTWGSKRNGASWDFFFQFQGKMAAAFQPKRKSSTHSRFSTKKNERKSTWGGDPPIGEDAIGGKKKQVEPFFALEQQCKTREKKIEKEKGVFKKWHPYFKEEKIKAECWPASRAGSQSHGWPVSKWHASVQFHSPWPHPQPHPLPFPLAAAFVTTPARSTAAAGRGSRFSPGIENLKKIKTTAPSDRKLGRDKNEEKNGR